MRLGSLFSGVGGFDLAAESAGIDVAFQVEIDSAASKALAHRFPGVLRYSDIQEVNGAQLPAIDVLVGGFPCQDLSVAGRRAGLDGSRSGLFWEFMRLVEETEPTWVVLENVPGLLSSNGGRDMGAVVGALVERGYGWAYRVLDAQTFGVPQRRRRVFIVGHRGDWRRAAQVLLEPESLRGNPASSSAARPDVAAPLTRGSAASRGVNPPGRRREDDINLIVLDEQNARVVEEVGTLAAGNGKSQNRGFAVLDTASAVTASAGHHGHSSPRGDGTDNQIVGAVTPIDLRQATRSSGATGVGTPGTGIGEPGDPSHVVTEVPPAIFQCQGNNVGPMGALRTGNGGLTGGVPFTPTSDPAASLTANYGKQPDSSDRNGGPPNLLIEGGGARALTSPADRQDGTCDNYVAAFDPVNVTSNVNRTRVEAGRPANTLHAKGQAVLGPLVGVRRLMPVETERLQGFPDGWTCLEDHDQPCDCKDSARYRQMGNAVAVPVVAWLLRRLAAVDALDNAIEEVA